VALLAECCKRNEEGATEPLHDMLALLHVVYHPMSPGSPEGAARIGSFRERVCGNVQHPFNEAYAAIAEPTADGCAEILDDASHKRRFLEAVC